jgi:hypothetical protein
MSYRKLCNSCSPITTALTSNEKYMIDDGIYCNVCTKMMKYPGVDVKCSCKEFNKIDIEVVVPQKREHNKFRCCSGKEPGVLYHNYATRN